MTEMVSQELVEKKIFLIRGQRVMVDRDLADLYGVKTKQLNQQIRRNIQRFPSEFMFRLADVEKDELVHICHRFESMKHSTSLPYVFTEHGVAMLSSVLNSEQAIRINIAIIKTFVKIREILSTHKELAHKLSELEHKIEKHDTEIHAIFEAIRQLMAPSPAKPKPKIGFHP